MKDATTLFGQDPEGDGKGPVYINWEATTANISESVNAALYLRMDSYFTSNSHEEGGPSHVA